MPRHHVIGVELAGSSIFTIVAPVVPESRAKQLPPVPAGAPPQRILINFSRWAVALGPRRRPPPQALRLWAIVTIAVSIAVVIASMFALDVASDAWARQLPPLWREVFEEITRFGVSGWFLYPLGFMLFALAALTSAALPRMTQGVLAALAARCGFLFAAIAAPGLFVTIIKRVIGRARPFVGGIDDPFLYKPMIWQPAYASMPSGHATTAAAAAIAVGAVWPRARGVMWLYAVLIMLSRIIVVAHHPSDVIAGALVGAIGVVLIRRFFAARGLVFSAVDLQAFPGPSWRRLVAAGRRIVSAR